MTRAIDSTNLIGSGGPVLHQETDGDLVNGKHCQGIQTYNGSLNNSSTHLASPMSTCTSAIGNVCKTVKWPSSFDAKQIMNRCNASLQHGNPQAPFRCLCAPGRRQTPAGCLRRAASPCGQSLRGSTGASASGRGRLQDVPLLLSSLISCSTRP